MLQTLKAAEILRSLQSLCCKVAVTRNKRHKYLIELHVVVLSRAQQINNAHFIPSEMTLQ